MKPLRALGRIGAAALLLLLGLLPLCVVAQSIAVTPESWDYAEVAIGESVVKAFTIASLGPDDELRVDIIRIVDDDSDAFRVVSIDPPITFPHYLEVGETLEVVVSYAPGSVGLHTASLLIYSNAHDAPFIYVPLQGTGVDIPPIPAEAMAAVLAFYHDALADGTLYGLGKTPQAQRSHLRRFTALLDDIYALILAGDEAGACTALAKVMVRSDGATPPPDLVGGSAVPSLNAMLATVAELLGCG